MAVLREPPSSSETLKEKELFLFSAKCLPTQPQWHSACEGTNIHYMLRSAQTSMVKKVEEQEKVTKVAQLPSAHCLLRTTTKAEMGKTKSGRATYVQELGLVGSCMHKGENSNQIAFVRIRRWKDCTIVMVRRLGSFK